MLVELNPGEFVMGRKSAAKALKMSEQSIRTCVIKLIKYGNLTTRTTNRFTVISITNWGAYQQCENDINQQINQHPTSTQPASNHEQEVKEVKKLKKETKPLSKVAPLDEELAAYLAEKIKTHSPNADLKPKKWPDTIRLMRERDNRTEQEIRAVIDFATNDNFWKANILSAVKLRKQFDALRLKANQPTNNNGNSRMDRTIRALDEFMEDETNGQETVQIGYSGFDRGVSTK